MGYFMVLLWIIIIPLIIGNIITDYQTEYKCMKCWLYGQFFVWAVFQLIAVPCILKGKSLYVLSNIYLGIIAVFVVISIIMWWIRKSHCRSVEKIHHTFGLERIAVVFIILFIVQVVATFVLAVNDGDDAFYMAVANISQSGGTMYEVNPYSVGAISLNYRYALAPFPIWIAFLSYISGVHTLVIGHLILGVFMLVMFYGIHFLLAHELLEEKREICMFMMFMAVLVIWGNTSSHTAASFLITRSRQGKALVASIVLPMMWYMITYAMRSLKNHEKLGWRYHAIIASVMLTASLGSSMGGALCLLVWGSFLVASALLYKKPHMLLTGMITSLPVALFVLIYILQ